MSVVLDQPMGGSERVIEGKNRTYILTHVDSMPGDGDLTIDEISQSYQRYVDGYPHDAGFEMHGETGLPLKDAVTSGDDSRLMHIVSDIDFECLLVPEIDRESAKISENKEAIRGLKDEVSFSLPVQLMNIQKVQISSDHTTYWEYTVERVNGHKFTGYPITPDDIRQFETVISLVLVTKTSVEDRNMRTVLQNSDSIASYLAYPTLEGIAKRYCNEYVTEAGVVKKGKKVNTYRGERSHGDRVNNFGYLLYHIETVAGSPDLQQELQEMRAQVSDFYNWDEDEVYGRLAGFRNSWLHGESYAKAEYGTLICYTALLLWAMMLEK
ncbi:hypothetical protein [Haloferax volcanii]|uniref:hypothetical protein n=1 Tax=Haloferax volcanii TaxID=2246 RepID=UPI00385C0F64